MLDGHHYRVWTAESDCGSKLWRGGKRPSYEDIGHQSDHGAVNRKMLNLAGLNHENAWIRIWSQQSSNKYLLKLIVIILYTILL